MNSDISANENGDFAPSSAPRRVILHLDMDAFFASVEIRDNPELKDKPLIIGALPNERGVVSTCSYAARSYGVRSGMSIKEAYRLCPNGIYMHGHYSKYEAVSRQMHQILLEYSNQALFIASDEGYLDLTASLALFGSAEAIGREIKARVQEVTSLTCSVGIGYNMMSAKLASEEKKPNGFFIIPDEESFTSLIIDRPLRVLLGIGAKTAQRASALGIKTVRDLLGWSEESLVTAFGDSAHGLYQMARGIDNREVPVNQGESKSYGREITYQRDLTETDEMESALRLIARELSLGLQRQGRYASTVTLKLKFNDLKLMTRCETVEPATNDAGTMFEVALRLLKANPPEKPVRLIGIATSHFTDSPVAQLTLDDGREASHEKKAQLNESLLKLYDRYGDRIIQTGAEIESERTLESKF